MALIASQIYSGHVVNGKSDYGFKRNGREEIVKHDPPRKNLNLVFVVQFRDPTEPGPDRFAGRAEHVMSGENVDFETPEELVDFLGRVMSQRKARSQRN